MVAPLLVNNLLVNVARGKICAALGVKLVSTTEIVSLAKNAGYDSLFIDLEHSSLSLSHASQLCAAGTMSGITPFVRVPHQCGNGFIQRVLDGGAMGVIFPHISTIEEAQAAVGICKYPRPGTRYTGKRSLTAALPQFQYRPMPPAEIMAQLDESGSTVFLMIETAEALSNIEGIAAVPGAEVLLIGANDLSHELGIQGQWDNPIFTRALEKVATSCKNNGRIFGLAGLYNRPELCSDAIQRLGARFILGNLDMGLLAAGANENVKVLKALE